MVDHRLEKRGTDEVLVSHLARMHLHRHLAGQLRAQHVVQLDYRFRRKRLRKVNLCLFHLFRTFLLLNLF